MGFFEELTQELRAAGGATIASAHPAAERDLDRRIDCPQCGERMDTHRYGGPGNVILYSCTRCQGNWLDFSGLCRTSRAPHPPPPFVPRLPSRPAQLSTLPHPPQTPPYSLH